MLLGLRYSQAFADVLFQEVLGMEESVTYQAIVELRGPLDPRGMQIYRVRVRRKPKPAHIELREDQLVLIPPEA